MPTCDLGRFAVRCPRKFDIRYELCELVIRQRCHSTLGCVERILKVAAYDACDKGQEGVEWGPHYTESRSEQ